VHAAEPILDRTLGKPPQTINVGGDPKWIEAFHAAIVGSEAQAAADADVVEGEIVEETADQASASRVTSTTTPTSLLSTFTL
jgi:hypothetical protein